MSAAAASLLRPGLLEGRTLVLASVSESELGRVVRETCEGLGANVHAETEAVGAADVLVVDLAGAFAGAIGTASERLVRCMEDAWSVTRTVAAGAFLPAADRAQRGGRIIYITPASEAGLHAEAVRAAAENLARTLSIEWARFAIATVAIAPGAATGAEEVATLVAYLASAAGEYFSGCQLDLRGV